MSKTPEEETASDHNWKRFDGRSALFPSRTGADLIFTKQEIGMAVTHLGEIQTIIEDKLNEKEDPDLRLALQHLDLALKSLQTH